MDVGRGSQEARPVERDLLADAEVLVLLDEGDGRRAREEDVDRVRVGRLGRRQVGAVVGRALERGIGLADDLAAVGDEALAEGLHHLVAGRVVGRHQVDLLLALRRQPGAHRAVDLGVGEGNADDAGAAVRARRLVVAGVGHDQRRLGLMHEVAHRGQHRGGHQADQRVGLVLQDHLLRLGQRGGRVGLGIGLLDADRVAVQLRAELLETEVETVFDVAAEAGINTGEGQQETDLVLLRLGDGAARHQAGDHSQRSARFLEIHDDPPFFRRGYCLNQRDGK